MLETRIVKWRRIGLAGLASIMIAMALTSCYQNVDMIHNDWTKNFDWNFKPDVDAPDWPVTIVFFGPGATVGNVKATLENFDYVTQGSNTTSMQLEFFDTGRLSAPVWDPDPGSKRETDWGTCWSGPFWSTTHHARIYGIIKNEFWDTAILATTHIDDHEGCDGQQFGWSETVEDQLVSWMSTRGFDVAHDALGFDNVMSGGLVGNRFHENNGMASWVYLP